MLNNENYISDCKTLMRKASNQELSGLNLADAIYEMAKKYKSRVWFSEANRVLLNHYVRSGLSESEARKLLPMPDSVGI